MNIREILLEDVPSCIIVIQDCLDKSVTYDAGIISFFKNKYDIGYLREKVSNGTFYVAEDRGEIIALGGIEEGWIKKMFVSYNSQGRGIGGRLINRLEEVAKIEGRSEVHLYSFPNSERFYERKGYESVEKVSLKRGNIEISTLHMKKSL